MINRILILLFLSSFSLSFAQKKKKAKSKVIVEKEAFIVYTENDAETTAEARVIAGFLKQNPNHAKTDYFKKKLMKIIMANNSEAAKPTIKPLNEGKIEKLKEESRLNSSNEEKSRIYAAANKSKKTAEPSEKNKKTAAVLTHLFSNDPSNKEAYVNIRNKSKCNLIVKLNGKKYYNLDVPAKGHNFLLIDKGEYVLTTVVCDAKYSVLKKITKDIEIELDLKD